MEQERALLGEMRRQLAELQRRGRGQAPDDERRRSPDAPGGRAGAGAGRGPDRVPGSGRLRGASQGPSRPEASGTPAPVHDRDLARFARRGGGGSAAAVSASTTRWPRGFRTRGSSSSRRSRPCSSSRRPQRRTPPSHPGRAGAKPSRRRASWEKVMASCDYANARVRGHAGAAARPEGDHGAPRPAGPRGQARLPEEDGLRRDGWPPTSRGSRIPCAARSGGSGCASWRTSLRIDRYLAGERARSLFRSVLAFEDGWNLKTILRGVANGEPPERIFLLLAPTPCARRPGAAGAGRTEGREGGRGPPGHLEKPIRRAR